MNKNFQHANLELDPIKVLFAPNNEGKIVHEFLKSNCNYKEIVNEATCEIIRKVCITIDNTTLYQENFHENCRQLCDSFFNTVIPLPN